MTREEQIVKHLIQQAFLSANSVHVLDPEGILYRGSNAATALTNAKDVEICELVFFKDGKRMGMFDIIWGNGDDIISDCSDNEWANQIFTNTTATFGLIQ